MVDYPALSGIDDPSQVRVALVVNKQIAHVPLSVMGFQPLDATLTALAALDGTAGYLVETGADTFVRRSLAAGIGIVITNPAGTAGDSSIAQTDGSVIDSVTATYATNTPITTVIPLDDTPPLISEGTEILTAAITPKTTTNKLRCRVSGMGAGNGALSWIVALFQGSTCIDVGYVTSPAANQSCSIALEAEYTPAATSAQTISVRAGPASAGTIRFNGTSAARLFGGAANATLVVEEIKA